MAHRTASAGLRRPVIFFKVGGTWDMVKKDGKLVGTGGLDDAALAAIEDKFARQGIEATEKQLCKEIEASFEASLQQPSDIADHLPWAPHVRTYVQGAFYSLFSGDSSHLRASLIAPLVTFILRSAYENPTTQVIGAQGTDTADVAVLPLLDAFLFDTELLPILFTGSNRSHHEWNSDAPKNFSDLFQLAGAHLPAGSYWVFGSHLYRASDMLKIDPTESRRIENFTTFFAPRLTSRHTKKVIGENALFSGHPAGTTPADHPLRTLTAAKLYGAMNDIEVLDLSNLNPIEDDVARILDPAKKAVIIAAFALGNANNQIKKAAAKAVKQGKIVVVVDKSLMGVVANRYEAGLLSLNTGGLSDGKHLLISGHRMNKATARAVVTRALAQGFDQQQTQQLVVEYCDSRQLLE
jgi:L-asparaginase/Glu-tRNA(Gln) amidotransferase subunit D